MIETKSQAPEFDTERDDKLLLGNNNFRAGREKSHETHNKDAASTPFKESFLN